LIEVLLCFIAPSAFRNRGNVPSPMSILTKIAYPLFLLWSLPLTVRAPAIVYLVLMLSVFLNLILFPVLGKRLAFLGVLGIAAMLTAWVSISGWARWATFLVTFVSPFILIPAVTLGASSTFRKRLPGQPFPCGTSGHHPFPAPSKKLPL